MRQHFLSRACALLVLWLHGTVFAQDFPSRTITIVVPFAAGSATDQFARAIAQGVTEISGKAVVVDNRGGASGILGANTVARAAPDGYTIAITTNTTHAGNQFLFKTLPYDPVNDFAPLAMLGQGAQAMVVSLASPTRSVKEFLDLARKSPDKLSFGAGSVNPRVAGELLQQMTGTKLLYVPYKSNPDVLTDLIGARLDMAIVDVTTVVPHVRAGKLRALGVSGTARLKMAPEIPTIAETVAGYQIGYWFAAYAPAGTPPAIVKTLGELLIQASRRPTAQQFYANTETEQTAYGPAELAAFQKSESLKWGEAIRKAGIAPQ